MIICKKNLINFLNRKLRIKKKTLINILNLLIKYLEFNLVNGNKIKINNFCILETKTIKPRNIKLKGKYFKTKYEKKVVLKNSKKLLNTINIDILKEEKND